MSDCAELVFILDRSGSMYGLEADTLRRFLVGELEFITSRSHYFRYHH